jgi:hypothetical protein
MRVNERPLITVMEHAFEYYLRDKLYIWNKQTKTNEQLAKEAETRVEDPAQFVANATSNKIKDLSWSLDIKESVYSDRRQQK